MASLLAVEYGAGRGESEALGKVDDAAEGGFS